MDERCEKDYFISLSATPPPQNSVVSVWGQPLKWLKKILKNQPLKWYETFHT